uniref:Uncharacterized protein n=1 Tax=Picea glauca TaxID=3330 RepID=A0A124GN53_PICGL|nr:hypothetical protein ABT39_MTgene5940 [Picea glauca]
MVPQQSMALHHRPMPKDRHQSMDIHHRLMPMDPHHRLHYLRSTRRIELLLFRSPKRNRIENLL